MSLPNASKLLSNLGSKTNSSSDISVYIISSESSTTTTTNNIIGGSKYWMTRVNPNELKDSFTTTAELDLSITNSRLSSSEQQQPSRLLLPEEATLWNLYLDIQRAYQYWEGPKVEAWTSRYKRLHNELQDLDKVMWDGYRYLNNNNNNKKKRMMMKDEGGKQEIQEVLNLENYKSGKLSANNPQPFLFLILPLLYIQTSK